MIIEIAPLNKAGLIELWDRLVPRALEESAAFGAKNAVQFWTQVEYSGAESWLCRVDGQPTCAYGVWATTLAGDQAALWLMVGDIAVAHPTIFIRHSKRWIEYLRCKYSHVKCFVNAGYPRQQRWMEVLGFDLQGNYASAIGPVGEYNLRKF